MELLQKTLEKNKEKYLKRLMELVAIDTRDIGHGIDGGLEKEGQEYLRRLFVELGADRITADPMGEEIIQESIAKHREGNPGHNYDGRYNLYGEFRGAGGKSIMFNGHMDTMPAEAALWDTPPHSPVLRDGKLFGLGACDMKGGLMASVMAVELLRDAGIPLPGNVVITSVCDEEGGGNGSILAAMNGETAHGVVVCEPTDGKLILANMGFVFFNVETEGLAVHSGSKWLGVNAIEKAIKLIGALNELEHRWLMTYKHPLLPTPSLNVGVISGGTAGSTTAGNCSFKVCAHYLPGQMTRDMCVREFTRALELCADGDQWLREHRPKISIYQEGGGFEMDTGHEFPAAFMEAFAEAAGAPPEIAGSPAGCDARVWKNIAGCPTVQFGPGRQSECHAVNEYIAVESYLGAILIYANLILKWCGK